MRFFQKNPMGIVLVFSLWGGLSACGGHPSQLGVNSPKLNEILGIDQVKTPPATLPNAPNLRGTSDPNQLMLGLRFVEYVGSNNQPVLNSNDIQLLTQGMNQLYQVCGISFRVDENNPINPKKYGFDYNTSSMGALDAIRAPFDTPKELVVINTGSWDHGSMGPANAWTMMPGEASSGAVIEAPVASNAALVAHELGHYLNLSHVNDVNNMMNPVIYATSTTIEPWQCSIVRQAAQTVRAGALR